MVRPMLLLQQITIHQNSQTSRNFHLKEKYFHLTYTQYVVCCIYMNDQHVLDYIEFNDEQMAWYDEHQQRQAQHAMWLEEFVKDLPFEVKNEM